jgi:hypothetical protein
MARYKLAGKKSTPKGPNPQAISCMVMLGLAILLVCVVFYYGMKAN